MRMMPQEDEESEEEDSDEEGDSEEESEGEGEDSEEEEETTNNKQHNIVVVPRGSGGGGKVFRPSNQGGKLLRPQQDDDDNDSDDNDSDDDDSDSDSDESDTNNEPAAPPPKPTQTIQPMYRAAGGGKSLSHMQRPKPPQQPPSSSSEEEEEEDSSSSEEEDTQPPHARVGLGKQLRPPPSKVAAVSKKDDPPPQQPNEEEEEEEDDEEDGNDGENKNNDMEVDNDSDDDSDDDSDEEPVTTNKPTTNRPVVPQQRGGGKILRPPSNDKESDDMETSSSSSEDEEEEEEEEEDNKQDDMETSDDGDSEEEEDSDEEEEEFGGKVDEAKLVEGTDDKKYLDSLPEIERESILAQRYEKLKNAADMKKALLESKRKEREQKKLLTKNTSSTKSTKRKKTKSPSTSTTKKEQKSSSKPTSKAAAEGEMDVSDDDDDEDAKGTTTTTTTKNNTTGDGGEGDDGNKDDKPDTSKDYKLAQELALGRDVKNRDKTGGLGAKKQAALEKLRQASAAKNNGNDEESDEEMDYGSDSDSDDEYDNGVDNDDKPWTKKKERRSSNEEDEVNDDGVRDPEAGHMDFVNITIPRRRLKRWCDEPYFEDAVKDFFVRLAIGRDSHSQRPCYRLCKIIRIEKITEYVFPPDPGTKQTKLIKTNKWLQLQFAGAIRMFKMNGISDSRPSQDDVKQYLNQVKNRRGEVPTKKEVMKMMKAQDHLVTNYVYTKEDIDKTIAERKGKKISNIGAEKSRVNLAVQASMANLAEAKAKHDELERRLLEAVDQGEEDTLTNKVNLAKEEISDLEADLEQIKEDQKKVLRAEANRKIRSKKSKLQDLVTLNERAKKANKVADVEAYRADQERSKKKEAGVKPAFNPYARRQVKAKILWQVGQDKEVDPKKAPEVVKTETKDDVIKAAGRDDSDEGGNGDKDTHRDQHNGLKEKLVDQIQDLAIDDENFLEDNDDAIEYGFGDKPTAVRVRKGISLQEYLERKEAGTL